jgi:hypothetical protein
MLYSNGEKHRLNRSVPCQNLSDASLMPDVTSVSSAAETTLTSSCMPDKGTEIFNRFLDLPLELRREILYHTSLSVRHNLDVSPFYLDK